MVDLHFFAVDFKNEYWLERICLVMGIWCDKSIIKREIIAVTHLDSINKLIDRQSKSKPHPITLLSASHVIIYCDNYEEAKTRTRHIQCAA